MSAKFPGHTILIVDDNPTNLGVISDYLKGFGFKILVARSGASALEKARYGQPDLILLDVMMPGIDGFETCHRLKADEVLRDIPVIFMTALVDTKDKVKGFQLGAVDYITKPFQYQEVLVRVETHLALRRMQKQLEAQSVQLQQEINERKRAEQTVCELNAALEQFTCTVLHALKNPLTTIGGLVGSLEQDMEAGEVERVQDDIARISDATQTMHQVLEELAAFSRVGR